ncbi:OPT oligopeptide transporter protein-domain-containing protein [Infundibulicybe gibba]|nr:OPT oligopeptide transporter protein-domain-containing protein [Infundibulicybe gibba]
MASTDSFWRPWSRPSSSTLPAPRSEFSLTAVLIGLAIGCLICFTNLSLGLQSGWISMMSIQSALIVIVVQTTAVATGTMPLAAGFVGILPALSLLDEKRDGTPPIHLTWLSAVAWSCSVAYFGATHLGIHRLPPPDTTIRRRGGYEQLSPDDETPKSHRQNMILNDSPTERGVIEHEGWNALGWSFLASTFLLLLPGHLSIPLFGNYLAREWLWFFSPSLSYVGQGIIMGFPTTLSMNLGMLVGWAVLSPLSKLSGWALVRWRHVKCLVSLFPVVAEYIVHIIRQHLETQDRLVPNTWVFWGVGTSIVIGTILVWLIPSVRALGETDLNPVSGLGNIVANIIAGGVAEAGAQQAGDLMQDLKTGHLCGASPRAQFFGQIVGSSVSILVTATAYTLYNPPTAYVWLSLARLLRDGELPTNSAAFMAVFSLVFGLISAAKTYGARRQRWFGKWLPSGVAFAIGFLNTPSFSLARLIGGVLEFIYHTRFARDGGDIRLIVVASGFVLGEGVASIVSLVLRTFGIGVASCWGCGHGMCGGCPQ